jgi:rhomboid protease GluP
MDAVRPERRALDATPITRALIVANVVVYVAMVLFSRSSEALLAMPERAIIVFGGNYAPSTMGDHRYETLITSCFLHFSVLHLGFNMYALRQVGPFIERSVGPARYLPMYLVAGAVGSAASAILGWLTQPERLSAGASGAICGVIGAALVIGARTQGWGGPLVRSMAMWLVLTLVFGFSLGADNAAHAGGAVSGAIFAASWRRGYVYSRRAQRAIVGIAGAVMVLSGAVLLARDLFDPYALLDTEQRARRAVDAFSAGRCDEATSAIDAALRLRPRDPRLRQLAGEIVAQCRGPAS